MGPGPLRLLFDGRGHDVWGLVLVALAALCALGIWFSAGAVVGRWSDSAAGALVGLARVLVPVVLAGVGVLLIRGPRRAEAGAADGGGDDDRTLEMGSGRARMAAVVAGAVLLAVVLMGFAHLFAADGTGIEADGVDAYRDAGGLAGAALAGTLSRVIGNLGTTVVLLALGLLAVSLLTGRTLGQMGRSGAAHAGPALRALRDWVGGLFHVAPPAPEAQDAAPAPRLYDQDADPPPASRRKGRRKKPAGPTVEVAEPAEVTQLDLDLGPATEGSPWKLPSPRLLSLSGAAEVDTKAIEERGRILESALADHGVETRLIGHDRGPHRHPLRAGAGHRGEGRPG